QSAYRWISQGLRAGDGHRVRLQAVKLGRKLCTTSAAIERFFDELTRRSVSGPHTPESASPETVARLKAANILPVDKA
ncbi:MAG: hypothetical protein N2C14_30335, partial [Planctomycetales bacterium]